MLGALDSHSKEIISIKNTGYINALTVCELIEKIRSQYEEDSITLILDNARYQRCRTVMQKAEELNIELLFLPSYSPNLNLIERLWKLVKKRCLANRYYETFDKFKHASTTVLKNYPMKIRLNLSRCLLSNSSSLRITKLNVRQYTSDSSRNAHRASAAHGSRPASSAATRP